MPGPAAPAPSLHARLSRREFAAILASPLMATRVASAAEIPVTGQGSRAMDAFDDVIREHLARHGIPGGAVAVYRRGRLVHARGYGWADPRARLPALPHTLFRIASVSKPITAVAILTLIQQREASFGLDTPAFPILALEPFTAGGGRPDPRLGEITVRHLLQHSGGWDRSRSGDVMFKHHRVAAEMGIDSPPDHASLIRWMLGQPLDFPPGERYAYSNFGYCVLGRLIEKATGMGYETFVRERVLAPLGIRAMRIGGGRPAERVADEAVYQAAKGGRVRNVFTHDAPATAPRAYGFAAPPTMDAHGGWIGSAVEVGRFGAGLDGTPGPPLLTPASVRAMLARPDRPLGHDEQGRPTAAYYGLGWNVRPDGARGKPNIWHRGGMPGTSGILVRLGDGLCWAALFNSDAGGEDLDTTLHRAAATVISWPDRDLASAPLSA